MITYYIYDSDVLRNPFHAEIIDFTLKKTFGNLDNKVWYNPAKMRTEINSKEFNGMMLALTGIKIHKRPQDKGEG